MSINGQQNTYSFEEPQTQQISQQSQPQTQYQTPQSPTTLKGFIGKVGKGVNLPVYLQNPINTATASIGDTVIGVLRDNWVINNSHVIAEQG